MSGGRLEFGIEAVGQLGDVVLLGSNHDASTLRIKEFLTRNNHPYTFVDLDRESGVQDLLDKFGINFWFALVLALWRRSPDMVFSTSFMGW